MCDAKACGEKKEDDKCEREDIPQGLELLIAALLSSDMKRIKNEFNEIKNRNKPKFKAGDKILVSLDNDFMPKEEEVLRVVEGDLFSVYSMQGRGGVVVWYRVEVIDKRSILLPSEPESQVEPEPPTA